MKIRLHPYNIEIEGDSHKSLLTLLMENKIFIRTTCKGIPSCGECRIRLLEGEHNVIPPNKNELSLIGTNYFIDGRRLACQVRTFGSITVDLTDHDPKVETSNKKIRGFRSSTPGSGSRRDQESQAVQGTLILESGLEKEEGKKK